MLTCCGAVFGFATSQALVKAKHTNAGLRDQRAALECKFPFNIWYC